MTKQEILKSVEKIELQVNTDHNEGLYLALESNGLHCDLGDYFLQGDDYIELVEEYESSNLKEVLWIEQYALAKYYLFAW